MGNLQSLIKFAKLFLIGLSNVYKATSLFIKLTRVLLIILSLLLSGLSTADAATCVPPYAKIDSITSHKSCLRITDATKFCGGRIAIFNNCDQAYYVDGRMLIPHLATFPLLSQKNWTLTIKDSTGNETITVKGTSNKANLTAKPYVEKIVQPTPVAKVSSVRSPLFLCSAFIFVIIIIFIVVIIIKKYTPKKRHGENH